MVQTKKRRLKKTDPGFFASIGAKGGRATKKNHRGTNYFAKIAAKSHAARRRKSKAAQSAGR